MTGRVTSPFPNETSTMLAPLISLAWSIKNRISDPSGAVVSGFDADLVGFGIMIILKLRYGVNMYPNRSQYGTATTNRTPIVTAVIIAANLKICGPLISAL